MRVYNMVCEIKHTILYILKISYPYGYQKANKQVIIRVCNKAKTIEYTSSENLLAKANSQIGSLKNYNCRKLILNYVELLPNEPKAIIKFNNLEYRFEM